MPTLRLVVVLRGRLMWRRRKRLGLGRGRPRSRRRGRRGRRIWFGSRDSCAGEAGYGCGVRCAVWMLMFSSGIRDSRLGMGG